MFTIEPKDVRNAMAQVLTASAVQISDQIANNNGNEFRGIEKLFSDPFESVLERKYGRKLIDRDLALIGATQHYPGRKKGRFDCFFPDASTVFEYKAVRLPGPVRKRGSLYYIGQMAPDFLRMERAKKVCRSYLVAFLYGPLVCEAPTPQQLYKIFHNQNFVDFACCRASGAIDGRTSIASAITKMGWDNPCYEARVPEGVMALVEGSIGVVCIKCR